MKNTVFLASVSGGADSTAMLAALIDCREQNPLFNLHCIHVEHGIRAEQESRGDAEFVKSFCRENRVDCRIVHIPPGRVASVAAERGIGIEAAARLYRRRIWSQEISRLKKMYQNDINACRVYVLTAHTADDMLETVLMRILRGAGPAGLAAMPAVRGSLLRPLLALNRSDVIAYLTEKNISWREDASNTNVYFLRNRIRRRLVPLLTAEFPRWRTALDSVASSQSLAAAFIKDEAAARINWKMKDYGQKAVIAAFTAAETFFSQPAIIREEALFQGIAYLLSAFQSAAYRRSIKLANIRRFCGGAVTAMDVGPVRLTRNSQYVIISPAVKDGGFGTTSGPVPFAAPSESGFSLLINTPGLYTVKGITVAIGAIRSDSRPQSGACRAFLPLVLRPWHKDDNSLCHSGKKYILTAVDSCGSAACMDRDGSVQCRTNDNGPYLLQVRTRGTNA